MTKRPNVALIVTAENAAAQLIDDTVAQQYRFVQTSAGLVTILGPIEYGKTKRFITTDPQREIQNTILVGGATVEVIAASTRYKIEIWNPEADYEGHAQSPQVFAYTSAAVLSGNAYTDRTNVYTALVDKINAYAGNNVTAYGLTRCEYTGGTSTGDAATNFVVGEVVTQETSTLTAQVAACSISSGTFAADNAAGTIWLYNLSSYTGWLETAKTLTAAGTAAATTLTPATTNCVVTQTNATTYHYQGLVVVDDAGYFYSTKSRGGINRVARTAGFSTATATVAIAGQYSIGIGTDMLSQIPIFDMTGQELLSGKMEYNFANGSLPVAGQTYERIVIETLEGDEIALGGEEVKSVRQYILWFNDSSHADYTHDLITALTTVAAK